MVQYTKNDSTASDTSGNIIVFDMAITTPTSFPIYVAKDEELSLDCTVSPAGATGGTYLWSKVAGSGTVTFGTPAAKSTTFSADAVGTYTVMVQYTKDGSTASDISGVICVVGVDHLEIYAEETWHEKNSIVILKGAKYSFKAVPTPAGASWPSDKPVWSGAASGTGATIEASFASAGSHPLTATCGTSAKTMSISVIQPEIDEVAFVSGTGATAYDIDDGSDRWRRDRPGDQTGENDPGCFKKGGKTAVRTRLWHASTLTFDTEVVLTGNVETGDEYITGGDYQRTVALPKSTWTSQMDVMESTGTTRNYVDYDTDTDIDWAYTVTWGTNTSIDAGDSDNLYYCIVWDAHKNGNPNVGRRQECPIEAFADAHYTKEHVKDACKWGWEDNATTVEQLADKVCDSVHRSSVPTAPARTVANCWSIHETETGDCEHLALNMAYAMRCLGLEWYTTHANLKPVGGGLNNWGEENGAAKCSDCQGVVVAKMGDSLTTSNNWQGCTYRTVAATKRDTICWDVQHNKKQKEYWELGNDKSDPADAPGERFGILYDYHWRATGGGTLQQVLSGDSHEGHNLDFSPPWAFEYHGN